MPFHVSGMRCVFAQNHESERDALILLSLLLSWICAKTQRIPDTWDGTLIFSTSVQNLTFIKYVCHYKYFIRYDSAVQLMIQDRYEEAIHVLNDKNLLQMFAETYTLLGKSRKYLPLKMIVKD